MLLVITKTIIKVNFEIMQIGKNSISHAYPRLVVTMEHPDNVFPVLSAIIQKKINGNRCLICLHVVAGLVWVF